MKECNKVFFGEKGITSTSANHLANIAKESVESNRIALNGATFVTSTASLLSGGNARVLQEGRNEAYLDGLHDLISEIAEMNSFCAWMREAIKARENELSLIDNMSIEDYAKIVGAEIPDYPSREYYMSEDDVIASMNVAERMEYLRLDATAAVIGGFIHPGMPFNKARELMMQKIANPSVLRGEGRDAIIFNYSPSVSSDKVEETFMSLQQEHRNLESRLNKIKFNIKSVMDADKAKKDAEFQEALRKRIAFMDKLAADMNVYKNEERKKLLALKIVIPKDLTVAYNKLAAKVTNKE